jgi:hypothetical protein
MATDGHVISPLFFPGGDIGCLSVHGTVNDVAMMGATPLYLAASFIIEEGFALADLKRIVESMAAPRARPACPSSPATPRWWSRARATACSSAPPASAWCRRARHQGGARRPGDAVLLSGTHGRPRRGGAVAARVAGVRDHHRLRHRRAAHTGASHAGRLPGRVRVLRDPTRGGLATTLNEIARQSAWACCSTKRRFRSAAGGRGLRAAGLDPLYVANEGKLVAIVRADAAEPRWPRCAPTRWAPMPRASAWSPRTRTTSCRWTPASAAGAWWTGSAASSCRASADGPDAAVLVQHLEELGLVELVKGAPAVKRPSPPSVPAPPPSVPTVNLQAPQPPDPDAAAAMQALKREVVTRLAPHFGPEAVVICRPLLQAHNTQTIREALLAIESKVSIYLGRKGAQRLLDGLRP